MADHFFIDGWIRREGYTSPTSGRSRNITPTRDRFGHGTRLVSRFKQAWEEAQAAERSVAVISGTPDGFFVQFESDENFALDLDKLDLRSKGIELRAVKTEDGVQKATVFIPEGKMEFFLTRFEDYLEKDTRFGKPTNRSLVESISDLRLATLESLWTEPFIQFPSEDKKIWWEIWLRSDSGREVLRFQELTNELNLKTQEGYLSFLERTVVLCEASPSELTKSLTLLNDFAELRSAKEKPTFFMGLTPTEQEEWVRELESRLDQSNTSGTVICVLDTGINRAHPLLSSSLQEEDLHSYLPDWDTNDHSGHGTEMAGVALFGNLTSALESSNTVTINHQLESAKILPPVGDNDPKLYGLINADAAARVEIRNPQRKRVYLMAITAPDQRDRGFPTSWSAAIDDLAACVDDLSSSNRRLFMISAGNRTGELTRNYFQDSLTDSIHDPGQSWNALTIGGYTELSTIDDPAFAGWELLARPGELCPTSTTSRTWSTQWPLKPDIVMEGGNYLIDDNNFTSSTDSLSLLTTYFDLTRRLFTTTGDTSGAAALAANMGAIVQSRYPDSWPETVRAIMVHSARWSDQMIAQAFIEDAPPKQNVETLLRCFGYGVPNLDRALESTSNVLTYIAQETIFPYVGNRTNEMILHTIPWPKEQLLELRDTEVKMRVTLSYFVEANPARRGWLTRHRYASHGLRFEVKTAPETVDQFRARMNRQARDEDEGAETSSDAEHWEIGPKLRKKGSIHSDVWTGTAQDLAERGFIGVYPVSGWWKERHQLDRSRRGARYSLIVSIETPATGIDLYTPVSTIIQTALPIEIPIST